jgi:hypothetical protein
LLPDKNPDAFCGGKGGIGMARIQKSIVIEVPVEEAFEFAVDWRNATRFYEGAFDLKPVTEKTKGNGARFTCKAKNPIAGGISYEVEYSDFVENVGWTATGVKGPRFVERWSFERLDGRPGATRVIYDMSYDVPVPIVGRLIDVLASEPLWTKRVEKSLRNLKSLLEGRDRQ